MDSTANIIVKLIFAGLVIYGIYLVLSKYGEYIAWMVAGIVVFIFGKLIYESL